MVHHGVSLRCEK